MTEASDSERQERKSAFIVGAVLLLIAAWNAWRGRPMVYWPTGLVGVALLLTGLLWAAGSSKFHSLWMRLARVIVKCCGRGGSGGALWNHHSILEFLSF